MSEVSAQIPDWSRETPARWWDPGRQLLRAMRAYQGARSPLGRRWAVLRHRFWSVITGAELPLTLQADGGLILPHPNGVIIHPEVRMGPNCMIFQQVTLGTNRGGDGVPVLGGHVDIGPGARVLGPVTIGDHAVIGANAVVLQDVPAGAVAVGVPARILPARQQSEGDKV
jgi:serine O-acetyltransferase